nr:LysR family transcriptional regulator [uncultured Anaerostipes sp.]
MDLNKIHYFFRAVELKNFTKASKQCHIAQTTMSKYIAVLEEELGCKLFIRTSKNVALTRQGQLFYEEMSKLTERYQDLCSEIHRMEKLELRIGMITTDYENFPILRAFEQAYPDISVYFSFAEEEKLLADLRQHRLDALICPNILTLEQYELEEIERIDLITFEESLVCSKELLEKYQSIRGVISNLPIITKASETTYQEFCRLQLKELYGTTFSDVLPVKTISQQLLMLNLSRGFAFLPSLYMADYENLKFFQMPPEFSETAQLLYSPGFISSGLQGLLNYIHENK